jgi:hypothetical protein
VAQRYSEQKAKTAKYYAWPISVDMKSFFENIWLSHCLFLASIYRGLVATVPRKTF